MSREGLRCASLPSSIQGQVSMKFLRTALVEVRAPQCTSPSQRYAVMTSEPTLEVKGLHKERSKPRDRGKLFMVWWVGQVIPSSRSRSTQQAPEGVHPLWLYLLHRSCALDSIDLSVCWHSMTLTIELINTLEIGSLHDVQTWTCCQSSMITYHFRICPPLSFHWHLNPNSNFSGPRHKWVSFKKNQTWGPIFLKDQVGQTN